MNNQAASYTANKNQTVARPDTNPPKLVPLAACGTPLEIGHSVQTPAPTYPQKMQADSFVSRSMDNE
jgi:hypothetical protein